MQTLNRCNSLAGMIPKALPSAIFSMALCGTRSKSIFNRAVFVSLKLDGFSNRRNSFSTKVQNVKDVVDANLYQFLNRESQSAKFNLKDSKVNIPDSFPFKIKDDNCSNVIAGYGWIVLQSKFDKSIEVTIHLDKVDTTDIESSFGDDDGTCGCEDDKEMKTPPIPMTVAVKKSGPEDYLGLYITVTKKDINIEKYYFQDDETLEFYYSIWQNFKELNDELQQYLYKYLELRGITSNIYNILLKYIAVRNNGNDFTAIKDIMDFIKN